MIETEFKGIGENPQAKRTHDLDHEVYLTVTIIQTHLSVVFTTTSSLVCNDF